MLFGLKFDNLNESSYKDFYDLQGPVFVDDDLISIQQYMSGGLRDVLNTHTLKEKAEDDLHCTVQRRMSHLPFIPVLTMNEAIMPDFCCTG